MLSRWPILHKFLVSIALLLFIVGILSFSGFRSVYSYRSLAKTVSRRVSELPLATELSQKVSDLRVAYSQARQLQEMPLDIQNSSTQILREQVRASYSSVESALIKYQQGLAVRTTPGVPINDNQEERDTARKMQLTLNRITELDRDEDWILNQLKMDELGDQLEKLHQLSIELPSFLHEKIVRLADDVRMEYRTRIVLTWVTSILTFLLLVFFVRLFYVWIFRPLNVLIQGSRRVAAGDFAHRIQSSTNDEVAELAHAMNGMTDRFQSIRADLDKQVKIRTHQAIRSEKLASVGFLAAGVAHEINNPLASIALCAEALESRIPRLLEPPNNSADHIDSEEISIARNYMKMIQEEAFRCKDITSKLLDFSRMGEESSRSRTDLKELVQGVMDMVSHLGKYRNKRMKFDCDEPIWATVNSQEIKQVILNLITNGLDSLDTGGTLTIEVRATQEQAEILFLDDGCGMTEEVREHLFEPFFTRSKNGQGTGLGLPISDRIVSEHQGSIEVHSDGHGMGTSIIVKLPLAHDNQELNHRYQAA